DTERLQLPVRGVRGSMTPSTALAQLLAGTGLSFRQVDADTVAVVRTETPRRSRPQPAQPGLVAEETDASPQLLDQAELFEVQEVQVTGTRIRVPVTYTAPNPVVTNTSEEMRRLGFVNVGDAMTMLVPQNIPSYQPLLTGDDQDGTLGRYSYFIGNTIANLRGMDPAFGTRKIGRASCRDRGATPVVK